MKIILSSTKPGHRKSDLFSADPDTFWHSDDSLPHFIHITFPYLTYISKVSLDLSYEQDDSYTPEHISIFIDSKLQKSHKLFEPEGTIFFDIKKKLFVLDIVIRSNHQEGRDSHVRGLKVYGKDNQEIPPNL